MSSLIFGTAIRILSLSPVKRRAALVGIACCAFGISWNVVAAAGVDGSPTILVLLAITFIPGRNSFSVMVILAIQTAVNPSLQ